MEHSVKEDPKSLIKDPKVAELQETLNPIYASLVSETKNAVMPKIVFDNVFLPYFSGEIEVTGDTPIMHKWCEFAGSPYSSVDLIDAKGEVVQVVPGIMSRVDLENSDLRHIPLNKVSQEFELRQQRFPQDAKSYLQTICDAIPENIRAEDSTKANHRWDKIKRKDNEPENKPVVETVDDDELDFS